MPPPPSTVVAVAALATAGVFLLAWLRQLRTRDATSVDLLWTLGIGATAGVQAALALEYALATPLLLRWSTPRPASAG
jgi:steroid 5-alpha reductase family enzyme